MCLQCAHEMEVNTWHPGRDHVGNVTPIRPRAEAAEIISDAINRHAARKRRAPYMKAFTAFFLGGIQALLEHIQPKE